MYDTDEQRLKTTNMCASPSNNIVVNQVIGELSEQESFDIHVCIPRKKPSALQIINVYVKKLRITHVHVIYDKVIVRGDFEVKAIYVGCMPRQPVHAVEIKCVRFAVDLPIWGARRGMDTDASVVVEYIDYDEGCDYKVRDERYKSKYGHLKKQHINCGDDYDECHQEHHHDDCDDECQEYGHHHHHNDCDDECHEDYGHHHHNDCDDECHQDHHHHQDCCCTTHNKKCSREFDISVVLRVHAKVMVGREIMINPVYPNMNAYNKILSYPNMPVKPKG